MSSFEMQYLIGAGVEYKFDKGLTIFSEFLHIRGESGDTDRSEARIGAGISFATLSRIQALWTKQTPLLPPPPSLAAPGK